MFDPNSQVELMRQVSYSVSAGSATSITLTNSQVTAISMTLTNSQVTATLIILISSPVITTSLLSNSFQVTVAPVTTINY